VSRGLLSALSQGHYGACLVNGVHGIEGIDLLDVPPPGGGYVYLVIGWDASCGLGSAGTASSELKRINTDAGACAGAP